MKYSTLLLIFATSVFSVSIAQAESIGGGAPASAAPPESIGGGESIAPPESIGGGESLTSEEPPESIGGGDALWAWFEMLIIR